MANHVFTFAIVDLAPSAIVLVWTKAGNNSASDLYWGRSAAVRNNTGDTAMLRTAGGQTVDTPPMAVVGHRRRAISGHLIHYCFSNGRWQLSRILMSGTISRLRPLGPLGLPERMNRGEVDLLMGFKSLPDWVWTG